MLESLTNKVGRRIRLAEVNKEIKDTSSDDKNKWNSYDYGVSKEQKLDKQISGFDYQLLRNVI